MSVAVLHERPLVTMVVAGPMHRRSIAQTFVARTGGIAGARRATTDTGQQRSESPL